MKSVENRLSGSYQIVAGACSNFLIAIGIATKREEFSDPHRTRCLLLQFSFLTIAPFYSFTIIYNLENVKTWVSMWACNFRYH